MARFGVSTSRQSLISLAQNLQLLHYGMCSVSISIPGGFTDFGAPRYEFYYDVILGGQYTFKIIELHKQYGPIIRISPWELHVGDPDFYSVLYATSASGQKRNKYNWFTESFGLDNSVFATWEHDKHKIRRGALGMYFSMQSVRRLDDLIRERVAMLLKRFSEFKDNGNVMMMSWAFAAFTNGTSIYRRLASIIHASC